MSYRPFERVPSLCKIILSSLLAVSLTHAGVQRLDLNGNGTSDIGELNYVTADFDPDLDPDEDGLASRSESIAGTNPFDSRSVPRITHFQVTTNGVLASMAAALGKRYDLQPTEQLCGSLATHWFTVAGTVARRTTLSHYTPQVTSHPGSSGWSCQTWIRMATV